MIYGENSGSARDLVSTSSLKETGWEPPPGVADACGGQIYVDYQVYSEEPAPTKPTSLGLANCQQTQIAKDANLPLFPPLKGLSAHASIFEGRVGKRRSPGRTMGPIPSPNYRP